jgi:hypothetical protein
MTALAPTTFATGIQEDLAAPDIYNKVQLGVINNKPNIENIKDKLKLIPVAPSNDILDSLKIIKGKDGKGLILDKDALINGIMSSSSGILGAYKTLPQDIQAELVKVKGYNNVQMTLDGVTKNINGADLSTITGIANLIKGISGCSFPISLNDRYGIALLGVNLIKQSCKFGLHEAFHAFVECLRDEFINSLIVKELVPFVISSSNYQLLEQMSQSAYSGVIKHVAPDVISQFTKGFKLPNNQNQGQYKKIFDSVTGSYDRLDPTWNTKQINNKTYINNEVFNNSSNDFQSLIAAKLNSKRLDLDTDTSNQLTSIDKLCSITNMNIGSNYTNPNLNMKKQFPLLAY